MWLSKKENFENNINLILYFHFKGEVIMLNFKKILCVTLAVFMLFSALPMFVFNITANAASTEGYYTYSVLNGEATITACSTSIRGAVTIPSTLGGNKVTQIGAWAFENCKNITSITIPNTITSIGSYAFANCPNINMVNITDIAAWCEISFGNFNANPLYFANNLYLNDEIITNLIIPDSVTSICERAFEYCSSLTSVTISNSVKNIGEDAFIYCDRLKSIKISDSVESIDSYAFAYCDALTNITIPDSVKKLGDYVFYYCRNLESLTVGEGVTSIGYSAFEYCKKLNSVYISDLEKWLSIKLSNDTSTPLYYALNLYLNNFLLTDLYISPNIEIINKNQFSYFKSIKNIFIPKSVVEIKQNAFYNCSSIKNIYFEGTAEEWGKVTISSGNDYLKNATVYFNCSGIPNTVIGIEITKLPNKIKYIENTETLDLAGGVLTLYYDGGEAYGIDLATLTAEGFDNSVFGKQTITVKYGNYLASFEIEIIYRPMTFVAVATVPSKLEYNVGEEVDLTGGKIAVGYPEGSYEILDITTDMVSGYDSSKTGIQILTVNYKGFNAQLTVIVRLKADFDGDGNIRANDITILRKALLSELSDDLEYDINNDRKCNLKDMVYIKKIVAGLI